MSAHFGRYVLEGKLATGGMAEVFLARLTVEGGFERQVVIKRVLPQYAASADFLALFKQEARIASSLSHPNIAQVSDFGVAEGAAFLVMEYVEGASLRALIKASVDKGERTDARLVCRVFSQVADALGAVHAAVDPLTRAPLDLVHRDVSPENVLLSRQGAVKLADFGIARATNQVSTTSPDVIRGKLRYLAPEQVLGEPLSPAIDVWALGVSLYEALAGVRPFPEENEGQTVNAIVHGLISRPLEVARPDLPASLVGLVRRCLARAPAERYPDCHDLAHELEQIATAGPGGVTAKMVGNWVERLVPTTSVQPLSVSPPAYRTGELFGAPGSHAEPDSASAAPGRQQPTVGDGARLGLGDALDGKTPRGAHAETQEPATLRGQAETPRAATPREVRPHDGLANERAATPREAQPHDGLANERAATHEAQRLDGLANTHGGRPREARPLDGLANTRGGTPREAQPVDSLANARGGTPLDSLANPHAATPREAQPLDSLANARGGTPLDLANANAGTPREARPLDGLANTRRGTPREALPLDGIASVRGGTPREAQPLDGIASVRGGTPREVQQLDGLANTRGGTPATPREAQPLDSLANARGATPLDLANANAGTPREEQPLDGLANTRRGTPREAQPLDGIASVRGGTPREAQQLDGLANTRGGTPATPREAQPFDGLANARAATPRDAQQGAAAPARFAPPEDEALELARPVRAQVAEEEFAPPRAPRRRGLIFALVLGLVAISAGTWFATHSRRPAQRQVLITSTPEGATIRLGTNVLGHTPWAGDLPAAATVELELSAPGFKPARRSLPPGMVSLEVKLAR